MRKTIFAIALVMSAVGVHAQKPAALAVPGRANGNVSLAASGRFVTAVWASATETGETDIQASVSRDAGATFSPPVRVNRTPGSARVSGEQPPRVVLIPRAGSDPALVVAWTSSGAAGTRLMAARSADSGRTFTAEAQVPGSDAPGNRGWESMAAGPDGRVDVIWLDHRDAASSMDMSHHMDHTSSASMQTDSVARAQLSKLYFASLDAPASGRPVAAGVCYCCKTALAVGADGSIYAAWRHVYPGNIRDIAFAMSKDRGRTFSAPVRVSEDKWAIDGCPENGPAIALDAKGTIHLAWPTFVNTAGASGNLALFYAASRDGRPFSSRQTIPSEGTPRHVQIATAADGSIVLTWDEAGTTGRRIAFARGVVEPNGHVNFTRQTVAALGDASYPALAITSNGPLLAAAGRGETGTVIRFATAGR